MTHIKLITKLAVILNEHLRSSDPYCTCDICKTIRYAEKVIKNHEKKEKVK